MKAVTWVVTVLIGLILALFAVANRQPVTLGLWPLPYAAELPLFLAILLSLLLGFVGGAITAWIGGRRSRRDARNRTRRLEALERELAATQARLDETAAAGTEAQRTSKLPAHG